MLEKIRQIKYSRLKDEERFFLETIDGVKPFISEIYPQSIIWKKNDVILIEQDYENGLLHISYDQIWSVYENRYGYHYTDIESRIKDVVDRHTNLKSLTPTPCLK